MAVAWTLLSSLVGISATKLPRVLCSCRVPVGWEPDTEQQGAAVQEVKKKVRACMQTPSWQQG